MTDNIFSSTFHSSITTDYGYNQRVTFEPYNGWSGMSSLTPKRFVAPCFIHISKDNIVHVSITLKGNTILSQSTLKYGDIVDGTSIIGGSDDRIKFHLTQLENKSFKVEHVEYDFERIPEVFEAYRLAALGTNVLYLQGQLYQAGNNTTFLHSIEKHIYRDNLYKKDGIDTKLIHQSINTQLIHFMNQYPGLIVDKIQSNLYNGIRSHIEIAEKAIENEVIINRIKLYITGLQAEIKLLTEKNQKLPPLENAEILNAGEVQKSMSLLEYC